MAFGRCVRSRGLLSQTDVPESTGYAANQSKIVSQMHDIVDVTYAPQWSVHNPDQRMLTFTSSESFGAIHIV